MIIHSSAQRQKERFSLPFLHLSATLMGKGIRSTPDIFQQPVFMIKPEHPGPEQRGRSTNSSFLTIFLVSLVLAAGFAGAWIFFSPSSPQENTIPVVKKAQPSPPTPSARVKNPQQILLADLGQTEAKHTDSTDVLSDQSVILTEKEITLPQEPTETHTPARQNQCRQLADRLHAFFTHLDQEEYIRDFHLTIPAQEYFLALATKLLNTPPVVSRESDDLYLMLKNMAHFFRVIGGKNIIILKGILDRERESIEDVASDLFLWTTGEQCETEVFPFQSSLDSLYEYAGFFLNSMGGRSYLFRRDSRSRLLVNYYAILLIDLANKENINQHGIDIKPLLPVLIQEIEGTNQLIYKEHYLDALYKLEERYL